MGLAPGRALLRAVVTLIILGILFVALAAEAQQATKVYRIGRLFPGLPPTPNPSLEAFRQGLREFGYVEGQNLVIEYRYAEGRLERLPDLAAELVRLQVDVIVAASSTAIRAAQHATRTIPIVMVGASDAVAEGFVASPARPGGNITGLSFLEAELPESGWGSFRKRCPRARASPCYGIRPVQAMNPASLC